MRHFFFSALLLVLFLSCSATPQPLRNTLLPLPEEALLLVHQGRLFHLSGKGVLTRLQPLQGVESVTRADDTLLIACRNGQLLSRPLDTPNAPLQTIGNWKEPLLFVGYQGKEAILATPERLYRLPVPGSAPAREILSIKARYAATSPEGRTAWNGSEGLHLMEPGNAEPRQISKNTLGFVFCGETLYWSAPDGRIRFLADNGNESVLKDFYPPDNSPLPLLGASSDGHYLFGVSEPAAGRPLFLSLDRRDGRIFMAPAAEGTTATAVSINHRLRYFLTDTELQIFGFQQDERGLIQRVPLP